MFSGINSVCVCVCCNNDRHFHFRLFLFGLMVFGKNWQSISILIEMKCYLKEMVKEKFDMRVEFCYDILLQK